MHSASKSPSLRAVAGGLASQDIKALLPTDNIASEELGAALETVFGALAPRLRLRRSPDPAAAPTLAIAQPAVAAAPANVLRIRSFGPLLKTRLPWLDLAIVSTDSSASANPFDKRATFVDESSVELACEYALKFGRPSVTLLAAPGASDDELAAVLEIRNTAATRYPALDISTSSVTETAALLASGDAGLDVIVTIPAYAAVLSEVAAGLACSAALATEMRFTDEGVAIGRAGLEDIAEPAGIAVMLLAAADLVTWAGHHEAARQLRDSWQSALEFGIHTDEFGLQNPCANELGAGEFAGAIVERLGQQPRRPLPGHKDPAPARPARRRPALKIVSPG